MPAHPIHRGGQTTRENPLDSLLLQIKGQLNHIQQTIGKEPTSVLYTNVRRIADGVSLIRSQVEDGLQAPLTPGSTYTTANFETTPTLLEDLDRTTLQIETTLLQPAEDAILSQQSSTSTLELEFQSNPLLKFLYYALPRIRLERATQLFSDSPDAQAAYVTAVSSFFRRHLDTSGISEGTFRTILRTIETLLPSTDTMVGDELTSYLHYVDGELSRIPGSNAVRLQAQTGGGDVIIPIRTPSQIGGEIGWLKAAIDTTAEVTGPQEKKGVVRFANSAMTGGNGTRKVHGGYQPTERNRLYLEKWKQGESIGFTMTASLKAKGLIPRESKTFKGKRVVSAKYR